MRGFASRTKESQADNFAGQIESNYDEVTDSFDNMNLKAELLRGKSKLQLSEKPEINFD